MKTSSRFIVGSMLGLAFLAGGYSGKSSAASGSPSLEVAARLKHFVAEKEAQAKAATNDISVFEPFFAAANRGDWLTVSNLFMELRQRVGPYDHPGFTPMDERLHGLGWQAALEIFGAFDAFNEGDDKYAMAFGTNIIASISPGNIYFGGTDAGRFIVTALQKSQVQADPFFTLTQEKLADSAYLEYARGMYGDKLYIPTTNDLHKCIQDYTDDIIQRRSKHQLNPGENYQTGPDGKIKLNGAMAVVQVDGLMAKLVFDKNPDREFYIEESFPFGWMYPYLEPHGPIMKINRQPLTTLSAKGVQRNHDYWTKLVAPMIGDWLHDDTSVGDIAAFAQKTFGKQNFTGFTGDPQFIQNAYSQRTFSKLRSSIAGVYAWRAQHATGDAEKQRMNDATDFAFRQAWALCPDSYEAVFRYVNFLLQQKRTADALVVAETAAQMPANQGKEGEQIRQLVKQLKSYMNSRKPSSDTNNALGF